ncbi:MAG TPA: hypothetical protein VFA15_05085, partial [Nitrososphaera sp.]|nr:hypothetical protein [Nitrososphaera sp.]
WAYRLFRRAGVMDTNAAAISDMTAGIVALTFSADAGTGYGAVQVFGSDKNATSAPKVLPSSAMSQMQLAGAGVWLASIPLSSDEVGESVLFHLFYYLGFGVAL